MHAYRDQYATLFRGGREVVLIAISTDSPEELHSWARDDEFPFLMASDERSAAAARFGVPLRPNDMIQTRAVVIVDPKGTVAWHTAAFREVDPTAYEELQAAIDRVVPTAGD